MAPSATESSSSKNRSGGAIRDVLLESEPVELYKILKFEGMADSGGEAKAAIAKGVVWVNGAVETRKRKKIVAGDLIEYQGQRVKARLVGAEKRTDPES